MSDLKRPLPWERSTADPPWRDGWLRERFHTNRSGYLLPTLSLRAKRRALSDKQLRALRSRWIATTVVLCDFTERERCSRVIAVNRRVNLDELVTIACFAVGFDDDEHLYEYDTDSGSFIHPEYYAGSGKAATSVTLAELTPSRGWYWHLHYDFGDSWHFAGQARTVPAEIAPALRAFERDRPDTPAVRYQTRGRAPKQYPHAHDDW
jgi:hypothetical protein